MLADDYVAERLSDYDSKIYQLYRHKNGQKASDLVEKVKNEIAECGLSATEAKGFLLTLSHIFPFRNNGSFYCFCSGNIAIINLICGMKH